MDRNNSRLFRWASRLREASFATLALAALGAMPPAASAAPIGVAVIESSNSPGLEFMDYVHIGQTIRLGRGETIVLSYFRSCVRETITGGIVTIGLEASEVQSGEVRRVRDKCGAGQMVLTGSLSTIGGRAFRGPPDR
jgi:hypothetical protein